MKSRFPGMVPAALLFSLLLFSCSEKELLLIPSRYPLWQRTVDEDLTLEIPGHMDKLRRIYMNETGFEYLGSNPEAGRSGPARFPDGTIVVKEIYESGTAGDGEAPASLMAMVKAAEDDRSRGGWIWVVKNFSTGREQIFEEQFCFTCHGDANRSHPYGDTNPDSLFRDYLFHLPSVPPGE